VTFWPILFLSVAYIFLKDRKSLKIFIILLLISLPLYVIAHDWGRFAIYSFFLSLICSFFYQEKVINFGKLDQGMDLLQSKLKLQYPVVALFPLLYISYDSYRIHGLSMANTIYIFMATTIYFCIVKSPDNHSHGASPL
jgi:hypothetical protein